MKKEIITRKYYCDICGCLITKERSKKKTILKKAEEWLLQTDTKLTKYYHYGDKKDIDICNVCLLSFKGWTKSRKNDLVIQRKK